MGKLLLVLALVGLIILFFGTSLLPQNPDFWLASGGSMYQYMRGLLALVVVLQLTTRPPRHVWLRLVSGVIALAVGIWTIEATYSDHMLILDTLCFISASVAIGVTALERKANVLGVIFSNKESFA
jgi:hypothetical protein